MRTFKKQFNVFCRFSLNNWRLSSFNKLLILTLIVLSVNSIGCKSSKKVAAEKARMEEEARLAREREEKMKREEAERLRKEEEAREKERVREESLAKVERYFQQIANMGNVDDANKKIKEALTLFSSPDAPVLIIISQTEDIKDYDKPTAIKKYLEYLKDQKKNMNAIDHIEMDDNGKIKELILIKTQ